MESYTSFIIVAAIAFVAPLIRGMVPQILVPAIVLELVAGIIVGPHGLGLASETTPGQQVIAAAAIAGFGAVVLLSFFYSGEHVGASTEILHLSLFVLVAALVLFSITRGAQLRRVSEAIERLEGTSAQIRVRGDFALVAAVAGVASQLGLETILAAFTVGVIRGMISGRDERHEERLDAVALGI